MVVIILQVPIRRTRRLGESWEGIQIWSIPKMGVNSQSLSEKAWLAREAQARPVATGHLPELQRTSCRAEQRLQAPRMRGIYKPSRARHAVRDFKVEATWFPESSRVIKLTCSDKKAGRPGCRATGLSWLPTCVHHQGLPQTQELWAGWFQPLKAAQQDLPSSGWHEWGVVFGFVLIDFPSCKVSPQPSGGWSSKSAHFHLPGAAGLRDFIWIQNYTDFFPDPKDEWRSFFGNVHKTKICHFPYTCSILSIWRGSLLQRKANVTIRLLGSRQILVEGSAMAGMWFVSQRFMCWSVDLRVRVLPWEGIKVVLMGPWVSSCESELLWQSKSGLRI
jgi:hypothetical protein